MKFDCGETHKEKIARLSTPHRWFAWLPVRISDHDCRWLETVIRTGRRRASWDSVYWEWKYEAIDNE